MHIPKTIQSILLISFLYLQIPLWAQEYSVSSIAPSLLENAVAVIREYHTEVEIIADNNSVLRQKKAITILEPRGLSLADIHIARDSFRRPRRIRAILYDQEGTMIRELGAEELSTQNLHTGYSVYSDIEFITTDIRTNQFPFTIEYVYEVYSTINYLNQIWSPLSNLEVSVENASLRIITPLAMSFRHKETGDQLTAPMITEMENKKRKHFWQLENIAALKDEPFMPQWFRLAPHIIISPDGFNYGGYTGSMQSWEEFGQWINKLNKGRQGLPIRVRREIRNLTADLTDTLEIIKRVHQYVQDQTRYVSINLGIGGFQPETARGVLRNQFGDCKALSNLTQALLAHLGIPSYYTLIFSGSDYLPVDPEFPHNYFNHAILCVPLGQDTLWLETTVSQFPPGYIGSSNSDRYVLVVTPEGGVLTRTPPFVQEQSRTTQVVHAGFKEEGHVEFTLHKTFEGLNFEDRAFFGMYSPHDQREFLLHTTDMADVRVNHLEYIFRHLPEPLVEKNAQMEAMHFMRRAGNRFLLQPVVLHQAFPPPPFAENRINPLELGSTGVYIDTIHWRLPLHFSISHLPENVLLETPFGEYRLEFTFNAENHHLEVKRRFLLRAGYHEPEKFNEFASFLRTVYQKDRTYVFLEAGGAGSTAEAE